MNVRNNQPTYTPVNFCAMKKSQFSGIDFAVIERFKAPLEKFNTREDLQDWAKRGYEQTCRQNYRGKSLSTTYQRQEMIDNWNFLLNSREYSNTEKLLIMTGITKDLKPTNDSFCPHVNVAILNDTLESIKQKLNNNPRFQFDFSKLYSENMKKVYQKSLKIDKDTTGWIVFPSKEHDPDNFSRNVETMQAISHRTWCTKHGGARIYLHDGDFHIYVEKGEPKLAIRFDEDTVREINGEKNDFIIAKEYIEILDDYIKKNDLLLTEKVENDLKKSKNLADGDKKLQNITEEETNLPTTVAKKNIFGFLNKIFGVRK